MNTSTAKATKSDAIAKSTTVPQPNKTGKNAERTYKVALFLTKLNEVLCWIATALMVVLVIVCLVLGALPNEFWTDGLSSVSLDLSLNGLAVTVGSTNGQINNVAVLLCLVASVLIYGCMAMIFRNANLILQWAKVSSPFRTENIQRLKKISYYAIAIPAINLALFLVCWLLLGVSAVEYSGDTTWILVAVLIFCLTQFFTYGAQLEQDVDGLV